MCFKTTVDGLFSAVAFSAVLGAIFPKYNDANLNINYLKQLHHYSYSSHLYPSTQQVMGVQDLQTSWLALVWRVQRLPQDLQNQVFTGFFFFIQMYNLNFQPTQKKQPKAGSCLCATVPLKGVPATSAVQKRATKTFGFGNGSNSKEYAHR